MTEQASYATMMNFSQAGMASGKLLQSMVFQPGIMKDATEYLAEGGWVDGDKIRFRAGSAEKIGGWVHENVAQYTDSTNKKFTGTARAVWAWEDLSLKKYLAVGSDKKLELMVDNVIYDITPIRLNATISNVITTQIGSSIVTINHTNHGLNSGDYVEIISQATPVDGISLLGEYITLSVVDANNYTIDSGIVASDSHALAGNALHVQYPLPVGSSSNAANRGWGGGTWGTPGAGGLGWGEPREGAGVIELRNWSFDNWGEDLIACDRNGGLYQWDATNGPSTRAVIISGAPTQNLFTLVAHPQRVLIAFGSQVEATGDFDPMIIRWATQETLTDWTITDTNTAGEFRLPSGNRIIGATQTRGEIVVYTETDVYTMTYTATSDVFQFDTVGTNVSCISPHSFIDINGSIFWIGLDAFYYYNGIVNTLPNTLNEYLFSQNGEGRINFDQKEKVYMGLIREFNELIIFYPRYDQQECSHYVKYNFLENLFDYGEMNRTVWTDRGTFPKPYSVDTTGTLMIHEEGYDDDGKPMQAFIRTAYFDIGDGSSMLFVDKVLPDVTLADSNNVEITIYTKRYPHPQADVTAKGPYFFEDGEDKISLRARGRAMSVLFETNGTGGFFRIGKMRFSINPDGGR